MVVVLELPKNMNQGIKLDSITIELVLEILGEQVLKVTGKELTEAEKVVIRGAWDGKDYSEIAHTSGHGMYYLQQKVGPPLWTMLSTVVGNGVKVKKANLRDILLKVVKKDYFKKLEVTCQDNDSLVGRTKIHGELPEIEHFYGRDEEINSLKNQIKLFKQRCISITGVGGIGKSLLAVKIVEEILFENQDLYDYVIWKKIERFSTIHDVVTELIKIFNLGENENNFKVKLSLLFKELAFRRCLLILDGFENLLQTGLVERKIEFDNFFDTITKEQYLSCTIITSQVPLKEFVYTTINLPILHLKLQGLELNAAIEMLHEKGLKGEECKELIETYRGNPSELEVVANKINRYFGGSIQKFFEYKTTVMGSQFQLMLHLQFGNPGFLSQLQRQILIYLAEQIAEDPTPVPFSMLIKYLKEQLKEVSVSKVMTEMEILEQRSLVETSNGISKQEISYGLQPVVKKYILIDPLGLVYKTCKRTQLTNYVEAG
ncbi:MULTISPECIES: NB-ARC domain-containing protein [Nostoc]|nr:MULTISPECIES: NB-ARC domain-containing protein [Nostoc]